MVDEKLIELVRKHEELYNVSDIKYNDHAYKEKIWKVIGQKLNKSPQRCKVRWVSLRDQFRKSIRRKTQLSSTQPKYSTNKKWKYQDEMSFLLPYFREKGPSINYDDSDLDINETSSTDLSTENPKIEKSNEVVTTCVVEEKRETIAPTITILPSNSSVDAIDAFFAGILATVKQFSPYYQNIAKTKIFSVVSELELKQILESEQHINQTVTITSPEIKTEPLTSSIVLTSESNFDIFSTDSTNIE